MAMEGFFVGEDIGGWFSCFAVAFTRLLENGPRRKWIVKKKKFRLEFTFFKKQLII